MKKLLLLIAAVAMLLPGCKRTNDELDDLDNKITGNLSISFDIEDETVIVAGTTIKVNYTITNSDSECHIATIAQNGWSAVVTKSSEKDGYITVTSPRPITNSPIVVFVSNSVTTIMRTLSFIDGFASIETDSYSVLNDATTIDINVQSNLDYTVQIPSSASSWISVKSITTRAAVRNDVITLNIAENINVSARTATIALLYDGTTIGNINIYQQGQTIANNEIVYTTTDGKVANLTVADALGSNVISNSYDNGRGLIACENEISTIGASAFNSCSNLQTIKLPDSTAVIDTDSFRNCSNLISVTIPDNVTSIGNSAFNGCGSLTSVTIPDSVTSIGGSAFRGCSSLTSVTIPDSVTSIGGSAFRDCSSLTSVTIPDSVTSIEGYTFYECRSLTSVTIPDSVTSIGNFAFYWCRSLTSITIPDGVTSIKGYTFYECRSLTSVTIPDSVTSIGEYAFWGCRILTSITIPDSVTSIGYEAFKSCSSMTSVYCKPTTPPIGESRMFNTHAVGRMIYVPAESVEAYKSAAYWESYADYIKPYNF